MTTETKPFLIPQALFDHVEGVALALDVTVSWPEVDFAPRTGDGGQLEPYLKIEHLPNRPFWEGLASGRIDQGLFQIGLVWPPNCGVIKPGIMAGQVMAAFAKHTELLIDDVKVRVSREPWVSAHISVADGVMFPITIPWTA